MTMASSYNVFYLSEALLVAVATHVFYCITLLTTLPVCSIVVFSDRYTAVTRSDVASVRFTHLQQRTTSGWNTTPVETVLNTQCRFWIIFHNSESDNYKGFPFTRYIKVSFQVIFIVPSKLYVCARVLACVRQTVSQNTNGERDRLIFHAMANSLYQNLNKLEGYVWSTY